MTDNGAVRLPAVPLATALVGVALLASGCTAGPPPQLDPSTSAGPTGPADPWGQLAARVAAAQDKRYVAAYTLASKGRPTRTVTVTVAADGSWLVTVPGAGLGGTADLAVADTPAGLYQCVLGAAPGCVRIGNPDASLPARFDPRVQYLFTSWLRVLTDRQQALAVDNAAALPGSRGECFSVEPNSAALAPPLDVGVYSYDTDGTLTAAALGMGTFTLASTPAPAPPSVQLPAPVTAAQPVPIAAPPSPSLTPSRS